jgi:hypothetical protein
LFAGYVAGELTDTTKLEIAVWPLVFSELFFEIPLMKVSRSDYKMMRRCCTANLFPEVAEISDVDLEGQTITRRLLDFDVRLHAVDILD